MFIGPRMKVYGWSVQINVVWSICPQKNYMIAVTTDGCAQGEDRGAVRPDKCGMWPVTLVWLLVWFHCTVASHLRPTHHSATKGYWACSFPQPNSCLNHTHWQEQDTPIQYPTPAQRVTSQSMAIEYNSTRWLLSIKGRIPHEVKLTPKHTKHTILWPLHLQLVQGTSCNYLVMVVLEQNPSSNFSK